MSKNRQITIVDIAEAAGVSIATVSNVLNRRKVPMSEGTIHKVEKIAAELGYRRNVMAANLSRRKSFELGLMIPNYDAYYGRFAEEMERTAHRFGYHMSVFSAGGYDPDMEKRHLEVLLQRRVDGLFCHGLAMSPDTTRQIVSDGTPLVLFNAWDWPQDIAIHAVNLDFADGCAQAVHHLAEQGCKTLIYLSSVRSKATNDQRLKGFSQGLSERHREQLVSGIVELRGKPMADLVQQTQEISGGRGPIGILAFDDIAALRFMSAVVEQGYRVPEQYMIFGINNDPVSSACYPPISTLDIPYSHQAQYAISLMLRQLGEEPDTDEGVPALPDTIEHELRIPLTILPRLSTAK
ncbi:transcriptional regulator, LacI family [Paenibacillus sp. 1_12]|uniref:LacI family DNA-binding transcriptional regulator n=1 Tax=Paenibacillus sp. 1_12 TaxID=1566278 RepID=UPI0008F2A3C1|nr:LacI family DNA-binding transcriptional regulator [Paenibacillus sp. 1_12]SFK76358.1 transcriptional regulator, LacI family [Paenibacillus sp. 1_12]